MDRTGPCRPFPPFRSCARARRYDRPRRKGGPHGGAKNQRNQDGPCETTYRLRGDAHGRWSRAKTKKGPLSGPLLTEKSGGVLLSQGISPQVPSALVGLTSVFGMGTGVTPPLWPPKPLSREWRHQRWQPSPLENSTASTNIIVNPSPRPISTGRLNVLPRVHLRPINVVVYHGPYQVNPVGNLILERASHLDAFSAYPFRRSPTSHALGRTTGTRELRPSRSSRTRDSFPQISYGCRG